MALVIPKSGFGKPHFWDHLKSGKDYLSDEVIVQVVESTESLHYERAGKTWKDRVERGLETPEAQRLIRLASDLGCTLVKKLGTLPFYEFKIPVGSDPTKICDDFEEHPDLVKEAEPNGILHKSYTPYPFPNDPEYQDGSAQWNLNITQLDLAWNTTTGNMNVWSSGIPSTEIAILDSGVNTTHQDLMDQLVTGYNVLDGTTNVTDTDGHGTGVASIASATTDNDLGIAGGAYGSRLLPVKVDDSGTINAADSATGINWAAENGANVINMSYGSTSPWAPEQAASESAFTTSGVVLIAASGNSGTQEINYPAGYPYVLAVGASGNLDTLMAYSTYGPNIFCVAPGDLYTCWIGSSSSYMNGSGTSLSAPGVSGLAGILASNGVPNYECVSRIALTCDKIDSSDYPYGITTTCGGCLGSWNQYYGYGRINFYRAMETLVPPTLNSASADVGQVTLSWSAPALFNSATTAFNVYRSSVSGGPYTLVATVPNTQTSYTDVPSQDGVPYYYVVKAMDSNSFLTRPSNELAAVPGVPSPTPTASQTYTPTFSVSPTFSASPTITETYTITPTPTITQTFTPSPPVPTPQAGTAAFVYPQPASGSDLTVVYGLDQAGPVTAYFYNQVGELAATQQAYGQAIGNNLIRVNISGWGWGVYYVVLEVDGVRRAPLKFAVGQ